MWSGTDTTQEPNRLKPILMIAILLSSSLSAISLFGTTPVAAVTSPSGILSYVAIRLSNNQPVSTSSPFQQMIIVDSNFFSSKEAVNLQNVEFFYPDGTVLPSWLESGNNNTATDTVYWLSLQNGIPAKKTITVYMGFASTSSNLFNTATTGEAPQLSPSYGQYDDGANVFPYYWNFAGTVLPPSWVELYGGSSGTVSVDNGLTITTTGTYGDWRTASTAITYNPESVVGDVFLQSSYVQPGGAYAALFGTAQEVDNTGAGSNFGNATQVTSSSSHYAIQTGNTVIGNSVTTEMVPPKAIDTRWHVFSVYETPSMGCGAVDYTSTDGCSSINYTPSTASYFSITGCGACGPLSIVMDWARLRNQPPNGVMPTSTVGGEPSGFKVIGTPASLAIPLTSNATYTVSVEALDGFDQAVNLSVATPGGLSCRFASEYANTSFYGQDCSSSLSSLPSDIQLYLYTSASTAGETYSFNLEASSAGYSTVSLNMKLTVDKATAVRNIVKVSDFTLSSSSSGPCLDTLVGNCFSIQQNFFVDNPNSASEDLRGLWVQNVVFIENDILFGTRYAYGFEIWNSSQYGASSVLACGGFGGSSCSPSSPSFEKLSLPKDFTILSQIIGGKLELSINGKVVEKFSLGASGAFVEGLCSDPTGCDLQGETTFPQTISQPQLDIVGEQTSCLSCTPDNAVFDSPSSFTISSAIKYGSLWSSSSIQIPVISGSTGEQSQNLNWQQTSDNSGTLSWASTFTTFPIYGSASSTGYEGVAFVPNTP